MERVLAKGSVLMARIVEDCLKTHVEDRTTNDDNNKKTLQDTGGLLLICTTLVATSVIRLHKLENDPTAWQFGFCWR